MSGHLFIRRNIFVNGRWTTISLEGDYWDRATLLATAKNWELYSFVEAACQAYPNSKRTAAVRRYIMESWAELALKDSIAFQGCVRLLQMRSASQSAPRDKTGEVPHLRLAKAS